MSPIASSAEPQQESGERVPPAPLPPARSHAIYLRSILAEALLCIVVALVAAGCAWWALYPFGNSLDERFGYLYSAFEPAIQIAAGNGMVDLPPRGSIPELDAYRDGGVSKFDTSLLANSPAGQTEIQSWLSLHYYLVHLIALTYRIFGVSRWSILVLCGFLHVVCAALLYGIFRLGMGRTLSLLAAILCASSPAYLAMCSSLRDFSKAPWILAVILVLGLLIKFPHKGKGLFACSILLGTIMGFGFGFRQDVLICLLPALTVVLVIARVEGHKTISWRIGSAAAMVLLCVALASPVLKGMQKDGGSVSSHTLTQGLAKCNEKTLGFGDASYEFNFVDNDAYCIALAQSYAERTGDDSIVIRDNVPNFGRAGWQMFLDVFLLCPADQFSRGLAAIAATPRLLTSSRYAHPDYPSPESYPLDRFERLHAPVSEALVHITFLCLMLGFAFLGMHDLRIALAVSFLLLFFGAYPSLLYVYRHAFHLAFVPYWFAGLCLSFLGQGIQHAVVQIQRGSLPKKRALADSIKRLCRGLAFVFAGALLLLGLLGAMWPIQRANFGRMIARYDDTRIDPLAVEQEEGEDGLLFTLPQKVRDMRGAESVPLGVTASEYLVAVFRGHPQATSVRILYDEGDTVDFSQDIVLPPSDGLRFFFPAIESSWYGEYTNFRGLLVRGEEKTQCLEGLYRLTDSEQFRVWPFLVLPNNTGDFIWSKKGPLEKTLLGLMVELRSGFGYFRKTALNGYLDLACKYPHHLPYTRRAFTLAVAGGRFEDVAHAWNAVLRNTPRTTSEAVSSLASLSNAEAFTPAELRAMRPAFEELWRHDALPPGPRSGPSIKEALDHAKLKSPAARTAFLELIEHRPSQYTAYEGLSGLYVTEGDLGGLEEEWRAAVRAHPGRMLAHFSLGLALERQDDLDGAIMAYERALILSPSAMGTKQALARALAAKAEALLNSGEAEAALCLAKRVRSMWAEDPGASPVEIQAESTQNHGQENGSASVSSKVPFSGHTKTPAAGRLEADE